MCLGVRASGRDDIRVGGSRAAVARAGSDLTPSAQLADVLGYQHTFGLFLTVRGSSDLVARFATRFSSCLISFGTPIIIASPLM